MQSSTLSLKMPSADDLSPDDATHCNYRMWVVVTMEGRRLGLLMVLPYRVYSQELQLRHYVASYRYSQAPGHLFKDSDSWEPKV